ncbi:MAG: hypothetical protein K6E50_13595 [Lachnospiraceae bacterium]|nr:hypothetical protein [Lachnospiraceae bacterium]
MNVFLLHPDREWSTANSYYDWSSMTKDLGLNAIFKAAGMDSILRSSRAVYTEKEDPYLEQTMRRVMRTPLKSAEEVNYRQAIMKDCFRKQAFIANLYQISGEVLEKWEKLGRKSSTAGERDTKAKLITDLKVFQLLVEGMFRVQALFTENEDGLTAPGLVSLNERIQEELNEDRTAYLESLLKDLSFYVDVSGDAGRQNVYTLRFPRIRVDCGLKDGLKIGDLRLETFNTVVKPYSKPYGLGAKLRGTISSLAPGVISLYKDQAMQDDAAELEYQAVSYVYSYCSALTASYGSFFDQLHFQSAFYLGAVNIREQMQRFKIDYCFPQVDRQGILQYTDLKEMVMSMDRGGKVVGNSGGLDGKQLVIITGANQGGKSTFLRSIGIAQVCLQCGLIVSANSFRSGIHTSLFTHFTRREDSAMNSGRLDEELRRMDQIVSNLGEDSLVLLNESFATTTEKDGSAIAYGIVKALKEEGVRIFTVTHLLSFAQKMYEESKSDEKVCFLCAEHKDDGKRTYRMIPHAPEQTSFGLELFEEVLGKRS